MDPLPINELILKGTHNSYADDYVSFTDHGNPLMNHPPWQQIDDFGVWALELDFSVVSLSPTWNAALVGHDDPCDVTNFVPRPCFLGQFLQRIAATRAMRYRPVLLYYDIHNNLNAADPGNFGVRDMPRNWYLEYGIQEARDAFGPENVIVWQGPLDRFPTVPECRGKAIIYFPRPEFDQPEGYDRPEGSLYGRNTEGCISPAAVEDWIDGGMRVLRLDQYQADWTFEYAVPPNPIVVDGTSQPPWRVRSEYGPDDWDCDDDAAGPLVGPQGTWCSPYQTLRAAVSRAMGTTTVANRDRRRAGYGWTISIVPGRYREQITISTPLTLERDPGTPGTVVIG